MVKVRGGLGRGLGALIPGNSVAPAISEVAIEQIVPNPRQPRKSFDSQTLQELADSISQHGVLQPLVVAKANSGSVYELVAGERRWQAAKLAGLATVPVVLKEADPEKSLELALVENIQRTDLNPIEQAAAYQMLSDEFGLTQEHISQRVGKSRVYVANVLRLLNLPEIIKNSISSGEISEGHGRALLGLPASQTQVQLWRKVVKDKLSVRQTEELVRQLIARPEGRPKQRQVDSPEDGEIVSKFREALGTKVVLSRNKNGGTVVIHFYSEEELQKIINLVCPEG